MKSYKIVSGGPDCLSRFVERSVYARRNKYAFVQGGVAYATDGCVVVWGREPILATYTKTVGEIVEPSARTVERGDEIEAPDMEYMASHYRFNDGTMQEWPKKDVKKGDVYDYERIGNRHIKREYARKIRGLGGVVFFTSGGPEDPIRFQNEEIRGVVMPLSQEGGRR